MRPVLVAIVAFTAGCLRQTEFKCANDTDCGASGAACEGTGYCSFADMGCPNGRRYGDYAGSYTRQCVDDSIAADAAVDAPDDAPPKCPATYMTLPNAGAHLYQVTANAATWTTQRDRCAADAAYLAVPDNLAELQAITTAAAGRTWVGIDDMATEGMYVTVLGGVPTYVPWNTGQGEPNNPGTGSGEDCVSASMISSTYFTDRCTITYPAICECEP